MRGWNLFILMLLRILGRLAAILTLSASFCLIGLISPIEAEDSTASPLERGAELLARGQYLQAWPILEAPAQKGQPEAVFYCLIIKRNRLDGKPAADLLPYWNILALRRFSVESNLNDEQPSTRRVLQTALAQLEYIRPADPAETPAARARKARWAVRLAAADGFAPARNFSAFLALTPEIDDPETAREWTLLAAEAGDHLAMSNLSYLYRQGLGGERDYLRAAHWARQAALSVPPLARAQNEVGYFYEFGLGVSQDTAEAEKWYEAAAAQQHPAAQSNLDRLKHKKKSAPSLDDTILY